ncbi:MAG: DUF2784 domain-containing protein [Halioglobus sp.]
MESKALFSLAADALLFIHILFVVFVVLGLVAIFVGKMCGWAWVRNPYFRITHLLGIGVVVLQSWLGVVCPLTIWEMDLRAKAGDAVYQGSFITHWLSELLYYQAPPWVFVVVYTVFGALVFSSWFAVRPRGLFNGSHRMKGR